MGSASGTHLEFLLFGAFPYVAFVLFIVVTVQRYRQRSYTYSSLSSQFLENRQHFWGSVPFHYGILFVLLGHLVAFLVPRSILWWNGHPLRLYILEITALIGGLLAIVGFVALLFRRYSNNRLRAVTTPTDWVLSALLLVQIGTGLGVAVFYGWGSSWFASTLTPYLWSLVWLNPDIAGVVPMPLLVKAHILGAFALIAFFPFTRLVHILVIPNMYLWRRTQVSRWYGGNQGRVAHREGRK
ncbi:MAG: respiratory nitrate reductase subunit gamma [Planctomycetota bacterium]|nr:respiratory nitrate reductase subunit gamma [Planctomycetota bacterium]